MSNQSLSRCELLPLTRQATASIEPISCPTLLPFPDSLSRAGCESVDNGRRSQTQWRRVGNTSRYPRRPGQHSERIHPAQPATSSCATFLRVVLDLTTLLTTPSSSSDQPSSSPSLTHAPNQLHVETSAAADCSFDRTDPADNQLRRYHSPSHHVHHSEPINLLFWSSDRVSICEHCSSFNELGWSIQHCPATGCTVCHQLSYHQEK